MPNIYTDPGQFGLQIIGEVEWVGGFEFDKTVVWKDLTTGQIFIAEDSGNSVMSPFESKGLKDLTPVEKSQQLIDALLNTPRYMSGTASAQAAELVQRARVEFRIWYARQKTRTVLQVRPPAPAKTTSVTREEAAHVLAYMGQPGGYPPGDWTASLIGVMDRADARNWAALREAFPGYGEALHMYKYTETGHSELRQIATGKVVSE